MGTTYVVFDGDNDQWAYRFMRGWSANPRFDFHIVDAHDLDNMTSRAQNEDYVKARLAERMRLSDEVLVLVGERTRYLNRFVRWERELALSFDLPIIAANLNESRRQGDRCPPVIRDRCVIHIAFKMAIVQFALKNYPPAYRWFDSATKAAGARFYDDEIYRSVGL